MSDELPADQELTVALARKVLDGIENQKDDARLADELVSSLGDYAGKLTPEDQRRFAEQISLFPDFMAACRAFDRACAGGDRDAEDRLKAEMKQLSEKSRQAMKYRGLRCP